MSPSKAKAFAINKIMRQATNTTVSPKRQSKSQFGVQFQNSFALSDDGDYVIGLDASDLRQILVEDLTTGSCFCFGENQNVITTLFFDNDSKTLLVGDHKGHFIEYNLDLQKGEGRTIKKHGDSGTGVIWSCSGVMGFVFIGGNNYKVRVYDLLSKQMLSGHIETAIEWIRSLQVCVVENTRIYLAEMGGYTNYSSIRSDLYDLSGLLGNDRELLLTQKKLTETFEEKVALLQTQLTQKTIKHDALLTQNKELEKENSKLKKNKSKLEKEKTSNEETVSSLIKANDELNQKLSKVESRLKKYKNRLNETLEQKDLIEAKFSKLKKISNKTINQLRLKLRIVNMKRKRENSGNRRKTKQMQNQPDPVDVIRDLEHKLYNKTNESTDMRNAMRHTIAENTRFEREIEAKEDEIRIINHQLMNIRAVNREG